MNHAIQGLMDSAMSNIKSMVDVDTVVGDAVDCGGGTVIIPISTVSFGFGAGGCDFAPKAGTAISEKMFGGGCGGGATVKPSGFLVVSNGNVRYLPVSGSVSTLDKIVDLVPGMIDKVNKTITDVKDKKKDKKENIEIID